MKGKLKGIVNLRGKNAIEKDTAAKLANDVNDVKNVKNRTTIERSETKTKETV